VTPEEEIKAVQAYVRARLREEIQQDGTRGASAPIIGA